MRAVEERVRAAGSCGVALLLWLAAPLGQAGCASRAAPPPEPPPRCEDAPVAVAPSSASPSTLASASASASVAVVTPRALLPAAGSASAAEVRLPASRLSYRPAAAGEHQPLAGKAGQSWLMPLAAARGQSLAQVDGKTVRQPWTSPRAAKLWGAADGDGGLWLAAAPVASGVFSFEHLERIFRVSAAGKILADAPFTGALLRPKAVVSDAASRLSALGTLVGTLTTAAGSVTAPDSARAEVVVRFGADGMPAWVTALEQSDGVGLRLASSPDGGALVLSEPWPGEQVLTSLDASGKARSKKVFRASSDGSDAMIRHLVSDGHGGVFVSGSLPGSSWIDLGEGPLQGEGDYLARLDASGRMLWVRSLPRLSGLVADGAGAALALVDGGATAFEIDADARLIRTVTVEMPEPCAVTRVSTDVSLGPKNLVMLLSCQAINDSYRPPEPIGKPMLFVAMGERK